MNGNLPHQRLSHITLFFLLALGLLSCLLQLQAEGYHLRHPDAVYYAAVARNLLTTGQFSTPVITQQHLVGAPPPVDLDRPWPVRICSLGYPLLLAGLFAVFGASDFACQVASIAAFIGIIIVVFHFARCLGGLPAALAAVCLLISHSTISHEAIAGELETTYGLLGLGSLYLAYRSRRRWPTGAAGALIGLAYVIRPTAVAFLIIGALVVSPGRGTVRWRRLGLFIAAFVTVAGVGEIVENRLKPPPLAPRTQQSSLVAQNLLYATDAYPGHQVFRGNERITMGDVWEHRRAVAEKVVRALRREYVDVAQWVFTYLVVLAIIGAISSAPDRRYNQLSLVIVGLFGAHLLISALSAPDGFHRYITAITVMLTPLAGVGLCLLVRNMRKRWNQPWLAMLYIGLAGCILYPRAVDVAEQFLIPNVSLGRIVAGYVTASTKPTDIILNAEADRAIAWYGQRRVIRLPSESGRVADLYRRAGPIEAIVVAADSEHFQPPASRPPEEWFPEFSLDKSFTVSDGIKDRRFYLYERR